jgi:peptidoglycan/xylan/chitin deacetylase (PgdA/CDA1 family)
MNRLIKPILFVVAAMIGLLTVAFFILPLPGHPTVLMYHFVGTEQDAYGSNNFVSESGFQKQMSFLKKAGYRVLTLDEYYEIKTGKRKSRGREVLITFDDGNYTFETKALPVLKKYNLPATIFLVSENVKGRLHGSMNKETIQKILKTDVVHLGAHSKTHPFLTEVSPEMLVEELVESKKDLEAIFDAPMKDLAYPFGNFNPKVKEVAKKAGYRMAFTTSHKKLKDSGPEDLFSITRTKITKSAARIPVFWVKVSGVYVGFKGLRHRIKTSL